MGLPFICFNVKETSYDRQAARAIEKALAARDNADVSAGVSPSRVPSHGLAIDAVKPLQRFKTLQSMIHRIPASYVHRIPNTDQYKASIGGRAYTGSFRELCWQLDHLLQDFLND